MLATQGKQIWMDGTLVDFASAHVHVLSHSLHYGVGVFEGIRAYPTSEGPAIFRLPDHVQRLIDSARMYRITVPYTAEEISRAILDTQVANGYETSYIRPLLYRGDPALGVKNQKGKVSLAIAAIPAQKYLGASSEKGIRVKISPFRKPRSDGLPSFAKACGNYLNGYLAGVDAAEDGYDEALLLDAMGFLAEGTGENIFLVRDKVLYTPGLQGDILLGVTRDSVRRIAEDLGHKVVEKTLSVNELLSADEVFLTGTYAEVTPVREIGHFAISSPGPITAAIMSTYAKAVRGELPAYREWLTLARPLERSVPKPVARPIRR